MVASNLTEALDHNSGPYGVKLDLFEGPLDLLLFLRQKNMLKSLQIQRILSSIRKLQLTLVLCL